MVSLDSFGGRTGGMFHSCRDDRDREEDVAQCWFTTLHVTTVYNVYKGRRAYQNELTQRTYMQSLHNEFTQSQLLYSLYHIRRVDPIKSSHVAFRCHV